MSAIDQDRRKQEALGAAERQAIESNATFQAHKLQADGELYAMQQKARGHLALYNNTNYTHALVLTQLGRNAKEHFHGRRSARDHMMSSASTAPDATAAPLAFLEEEETQCRLQP